MPARRRSVAAVVAALAAAAAGLLAAPGAGLANDGGSVTHSAGDVSATLEWDGAESGVSNPRLSVVRGGVRYDLTIVDICDVGCIVLPDDATTKPGESAVKVADLDGDGEPEVLVDTFSGGAHCCTTTRLLTWDGTGYQPKDIEWRDVGYELRDADGDGRPELVGYDPVFSYAFTSYADSAFPPLVYQAGKGQVTDVTRKFPKIVRADAALKLKALRHARKGEDVRGELAAYVADQYLLRHGSTGLAEVDHQRRKGRVSAGFRALLLKRLKAWGYR
jgi:hypothetical protein